MNNKLPPKPLKLSAGCAGGHFFVERGQQIDLDIPASMRQTRPWVMVSGHTLVTLMSQPATVNHGAVTTPMQRWRFLVKSEGSAVLKIVEDANSRCCASFAVRLTAHDAPKR